MDLDVLTTNEFIPYRDEQDQPRLLDLRPRVRPSRRGAPLYRELHKILDAGTKVTTELEYREWLTNLWEPLDEKIWKSDLGRCIGDEGHDLMRLMNAILDVVWKPDWKAE